MDVPWIVVIGALVGMLLGGLVTAVLQRRRANRLAARGRLECGLRLLSGEVDGLTAKWRHGSADLEEAVIHFRPGLPGGVRGTRPGVPPVLLPVEAVDGERRPRAREWFGVSPDCVVLSIRSGDARIEWAVLATQEAWVRSQVGAGAS